MLDPRNLHALTGQQKLHEDQRQWREAYEVQTRLARMRKSDDGLVLGFLQAEMGREALAAGRRDAAEAAFRTSLSLDRRVFPAHLALADLWLRAGPPPGRAGAGGRDRGGAGARLSRLLARCSGPTRPAGEPSRFAALCERLVGPGPARLAGAARPRAPPARRRAAPSEALGLLLRAVEANPHVLLVHLEVWRTLRALGALGPEERKYVATVEESALYVDPHICTVCRYRADDMLWRCPHCHEWNTLRGGARRPRGGNAVSGRARWAGWRGTLLAAALVARPVAHGVPLATVLVVLGDGARPGGAARRPARARRAAARLATPGSSSARARASASRSRGSHCWPGVRSARRGSRRWSRSGRRAPASHSRAAARPVRRRARLGPRRAPAATLAVALVAILLQPLASAARLGEPVPFDLLFHAGTAAELRHRWPLQDPRVAGVPLHYHVLAYALPIEAADRAAGSARRFAAGARPALLGRPARPADWRTPAGWCLATPAPVSRPPPSRSSTPTPASSWAWVPGRSTATSPPPCTAARRRSAAWSCWSAFRFRSRAGSRPRRRRELAVLALLAAAASGAKTTVLPVVLGGLALCAAWAFARSRAGARGGAGRPPLAVVAVAGAPFTLWQSLGPSSYSRMAHFGVGTAFTSSAFAGAAASLLGVGALAGLAALPLFLLWLAGFLGLAGIGAAVWLASRRERLSGVQAWALSLAGVALVASLLVDAPGLSQLFLLYNGQLLLCLFAGAGLARALPPRRLADCAIAVVLALAALPSLAMVSRALPAMLAADVAGFSRSPSPMPDEYARGLGWLRAHASRDAVVFADNPSLLLSAFGEVRLYYETGLYTARAWEVGPDREPWPERAALQERLLRRPDPGAIAQARRAVGPETRLLVVADAVQSRVESGFVLASPGRVPGRRLFPEELFELRFANAALHVYEARR